MGQWSSGYDVALTTRRSHVQFLPGPSTFLKKDKPKISSVEIEDFLKIISLSGVTKKHMKEVKRALGNYAKYILFKINKINSLEYFQNLQNNYSIKYYKKQMYAIKKFLHYLKIEWIDEIKLPKDLEYSPKKVTSGDITKAIEYFNDKRGFKRSRALILLGYTSGLRAEELYTLTTGDIDLEKRTVYIRHDPKNNHSTKNKKSRVSFFTIDARDAFCDYLDELNNVKESDVFFPKRTTERVFKESPIMVKDLRKAFSQEWDRRGGPTSIKKILMGHSLKGDVDLMHYNTQSAEDLKKVYDKVMID